MEELLARVRAVLRRTQFHTTEQAQVKQSITIGHLSIDFAQHLAKMNEQEIALTPIEFRILSYLAQNVGRVVTQDMLLEYVWGHDYTGEGHMLQVNVNRLRRKVEPDPVQPRYILTKIGIGYFLVANPEAK